VTKFSANLGFLFQEFSLPDGIEAAKKHGFDAVECHFPYSVPVAETNAALQKTGLKMLGLNTIKGDESKGDNGLSAIPGRIDLDNLRYATSKAAEHGINILIEPLNPYDAPGYYLKDTEQAKNIIETLAVDNLKLMFDCYHVQIIEGDVCRRMKTLLPIIGHIQIASAPDRTEPDNGELNYRYVHDVLNDLGYQAPIGAEYKPASTTEAGLGWMQKLR